MSAPVVPAVMSSFRGGRRRSAAPFMINYRVRDLDRLLEELRREGVEVDPRIEEGENGRFARVMDPEGNRIELWEPPE